MGAYATFDLVPDNPPPQSVLRAIQQHREVYQDYTRELPRTKITNPTCLSTFPTLALQACCA